MNKVKEFSVITFGTVVAAAAIYFFMQPNNLVIGSITGLAIVLENVIPLRFSIITFILNQVLLLLGFLLFGREFGVKTVYASILLPVLLGVFEVLFPNNASITEDPFIDMLCYLFVVSFGLAILFNQNASSGGLDIVAKIMNKYLRMNLGKALGLVGMCIAATSSLVYDKKTVVLSLLGTYLSSIVLDYFIFGLSVKRKVCIISGKQDEILAYVLNELHSGATIYETKGAYTGKIKPEVVVIVDKNEYRLLMNYLQKTDPDAFVTIYKVNEVIYKPKRMGY